MLAGAQLLLAAAVAASAGSVAAAALAPGSQPGALALQPSSAAQQALRVAARVAAAAAAAGGSCLHRLGQAVGFSDAGAFAAALVPIVLAVAAAKRWHVLLAGGALAALWTTGGLALLLARCRATLASSGLVALQSSGALDVLVAESTGFWVSPSAPAAALWCLQAGAAPLCS